jgi:hypothetical protein
VAIAFDGPWEGNTSDSEAVTAYAESRDGIRWSSPQPINPRSHGHHPGARLGTVPSRFSLQGRYRGARDDDVTILDFALAGKERERRSRCVCGKRIRHPIYAGAFVFGRSEARRELDPETQKVVLKRCLRRTREEWPVLIQDHHPGYISFEKYLDNQERLSGNAMMTSPSTDESHQGAAREGRALLQGLMRCGHCGRRMYVNYGGDNARLAARLLVYNARHRTLFRSRTSRRVDVMQSISEAGSLQARTRRDETGSYFDYPRL